MSKCVGCHWWICASVRSVFNGTVMHNRLTMINWFAQHINSNRWNSMVLSPFIRMCRSATFISTAPRYASHFRANITDTCYSLCFSSVSSMTFLFLVHIWVNAFHCVYIVRCTCISIACISRFRGIHSAFDVWMNDKYMAHKHQTLNKFINILVCMANICEINHYRTAPWLIENGLHEVGMEI